MTAIELIAEERTNQIAKGFTAAHDDEHTDGSLTDAARLIVFDVPTEVTPSWTFDLAGHVRDKYPDDPMHRLVIAAALLVAEIERRQRAAARPSGLPDPTPVRFVTLEPGQHFRYGGREYMKMETIPIDNHGHFGAIDVINGCLLMLVMNDEVLLLANRAEGKT